MKKNVVGMVLVGLAILVILQDYLPPIGISLWDLAWLVGVGYFFVIFFLKRRVVESVIFGMWFFALFNDQFGFLLIDKASLFLSTILLSVGVSLMVKSRNIKQLFLKKDDLGHSSTEEEVHEANAQEVLYQKVGESGKSTFLGSSTRYVHDDAFVEDGVEIVFGSANIYLDQAVMLGDRATFTVEGVCSTVRLYVPREWKVDIQVDNVLSTIKNLSSSGGQKTLQVSGDIAFTKLLIYSI